MHVGRKESERELAASNLVERNCPTTSFVVSLHLLLSFLGITVSLITARKNAPMTSNERHEGYISSKSRMCGNARKWKWVQFSVSF